MDYKETLDLLFGSLPMFQRTGSAAYKIDLNKTYALDKFFGFPHRNFKNIHIAGTNGKGSVAAMLASVLRESGYRTGLFTSPHYKDFRERIRMNGEMIPESSIIYFMNTYYSQLQHMEPSFFEFTFAMAEWYFARENTDFAVWETGLGGRLDSTNVVSPEVSVITNIGLDHMQFLGNTRKEIAAEKAGIIKSGIPVVAGEKDDVTTPVLDKYTRQMGTEIFHVPDEVCFRKSGFTDSGFEFVPSSGEFVGHQIYIPVMGHFQEHNVRTVLKTIEVLNKKSGGITPDALKTGFLKLHENTGFIGRFHILGRNPLIIADSGHNKQAVSMVMQQIHKMNPRRIHIVLGMVNDKDIDTVLELLPRRAVYYFAKADIPRGLPAEELRAKALSTGLEGDSCKSVPEAFDYARKNADYEDLIFVGGSIFTVAEVV